MRWSYPTRTASFRSAKYRLNERTLRAEVLDDRSTDPGTATGDEYPPVGEAWILRELLAHDPRSFLFECPPYFKLNRAGLATSRIFGRNAWYH